MLLQILLLQFVLLAKSTLAQFPNELPTGTSGDGIQVDVHVSVDVVPGSSVASLSAVDVPEAMPEPAAVVSSPCSALKFVPESSSFDWGSAVEGGYEIDGATFYVCRGSRSGRMIVGKMRRGETSDTDSCWVADSGYEHRLYAAYELLSNPQQTPLTWVQKSGNIRTSDIPENAVNGGREADGTPTYIGKCRHERWGSETVLTGSVVAGESGIQVPFAGDSKTCHTYEILTCKED